MSSSAIPPEALRLEVPADRALAGLDWDQLFDRRAPVAIEIGTGNGYFIEREAGRLADHNFFAIEQEGEFFWKMTRRCARAGLTNVRTCRADALELLRTGVPAHSVRHIYCLFSDPWPKRKHAKRRVFGPHLPPLLDRVLEPQGRVTFKTDVGYYFNLAVTAFRAAPGWRFMSIGKLPPPDPERGEVVTNFERKAREAGGEVWGFELARENHPHEP